jgi:N6-adenosine-specific RNA methylase IME4
VSTPLVIVADPPWQFSDKLPGDSRGAEKNYACLTKHDIRDIVHDASLGHGNCVLFLWRVAAMQPDALDVAAASGFDVKSELVWEKLTKHGKPHFGMGRYVRASHEVCLIAVRGRAFPECRSVRSRFAATVREHSRKPDAFYAIVERMYPSSRKVELFARQRRDGWECHGNQLDKFTQESA